MVMMVRQYHSLRHRVEVPVNFICIVIVINSIVISPTSSSPAASYSSSSLSTFEGESNDGETEVLLPSKSPTKLDIAVVPSTATTTTATMKPSMTCGCDAIELLIDEVRQTKDVCINTAFALGTHAKKVGKLQMAVDVLASLASIRDTNDADPVDEPNKYVAPTLPADTSSLDKVSSSSFGETDGSSDIEIEEDKKDDVRPDVLVTPPPSLQGVQLVIMEAPDVTPRDCWEVQQKVGNVTGVYTILPDGCGQPFQVFCDMTTSGGGWTVLQRRLNGEVSFARLWGAYRRGFGNLLTEFWLGLDKMSRLTAQDDYELRIDLQDFNGTEGEAEYESVVVSDYRSNFRLHVGAFKVNGSAGDSLSYHNHMPFTTTDRDNDLAKKNCAEMYSGGGWWFNGCLYCNLNGVYLGPNDDEFAMGVTWFELAGFRDSLKMAEMKIRPVP